MGAFFPADGRRFWQGILVMKNKLLLIFKHYCPHFLRRDNLRVYYDAIFGEVGYLKRKGPEFRRTLLVDCVLLLMFIPVFVLLWDGEISLENMHLVEELSIFPYWEYGLLFLIFLFTTFNDARMSQYYKGSNKISRKNSIFIMLGWVAIYLATCLVMLVFFHFIEWAKEDLYEPVFFILTCLFLSIPIRRNIILIWHDKQEVFFIVRENVKMIMLWNCAVCFAIAMCWIFWGVGY